MTWELYLYSLGYVEELNQYWQGQQEQIANKKLKCQKKGQSYSEVFRRIDQMEKSVELLYDHIDEDGLQHDSAIEDQMLIKASSQ